MSVAVYMNWEGATKEQYDAMRKEIKWETDLPAGGIYHIATFNDKGLRITDVWESPEHFNSFVEKKINPAVAKLGIPGQPQVEIFPVHAINATAYKGNGGPGA
jgi:hypothetical protein